MRTRLAIAGLVLALLPAVGGPAYAAFQERDIINNINDTVAVLRFLHRDMRAVKDKLDMVRNTRELTEKQHAAQQQIVRDEKSKGKKASPIKLEVYEVDLDNLKRQAIKLNKHNLEKTYAERLALLKRTIDRYQVQIEAKLFEFRVHFGKEPKVNLDFESKVSRFRQKRLGLTYLTIR